MRAFTEYLTCGAKAKRARTPLARALEVDLPRVAVQAGSRLVRARLAVGTGPRGERALAKILGE